MNPSVEPGAAAKSGYVEVVAYPTVHNPKRIASIAEAADVVQKSEVMLRGWNFPHTDRQSAGPFSNGFESSTVWDRYVEGYRLYQSGLFIWKRAYWEDAEGKKSKEGRPLLSIISAIWSFTEYLLFLSRLYERIAPDATVKIAIALHGCSGRELVTLDPSVPFPRGYISREDVIEQVRELQVAELRASYLAIAAEMVKHVFHVFGWLDVRDGVIADWQQRLLKRQL